MPIKFNVAKADLGLDSVFAKPQFGLFRDVAGLMQHLFGRLESHGLRLQDLKIERGTGSVADYHVLCHLYNFLMAVRVRTEKVEINWLEAPENLVERFGIATVETLSAVRAHLPGAAFRAHTMGVGMHGSLEGEPLKEYLSRFVKNIPNGLGSQIGNGAVFYFGAEEDRIISTVTVDMSAVVTDGLFVRIYVIWDGEKVDVASLPTRASAFVRNALDRVGLEVPTLKP